jgi:hypothetical protein
LITRMINIRLTSFNWSAWHAVHTVIVMIGN